MMMMRHPFFVLVEPFQGDAITCKSFLFFLKIYKIVKFPQDARWLELSICYHTPTSHLHTPPFLSSYHKHLTHSSESTTYSIPPCNNGKKLSSAFKQVIDSSKMQHEPSKPSPSTNAEDLLAFCTIITMLSFIQSTTCQLRHTAITTAPLGTD